MTERAGGGVVGGAPGARFVCAAAKGCAMGVWGWVGVGWGWGWGGGGERKEGVFWGRKNITVSKCVGEGERRG